MESRVLACGRRALARVNLFCLPHHGDERAAAWRTFYATGRILAGISARTAIARAKGGAL